MSHLVGEHDWFVLDLDPERGHVFVREDWRYDHWLLDTDRTLPVTAWTHKEKVAFHNAVDRLVWGFWSMRATFRVELRAGKSDDISRKLAERLATRTLTSSFDVRRVHGPAHWRVRVTKVNPAK